MDYPNNTNIVIFGNLTDPVDIRTRTVNGCIDKVCFEVFVNQALFSYRCCSSSWVWA